jgi:hypothetical protein
MSGYENFLLAQDEYNGTHLLDDERGIETYLRNDAEEIRFGQRLTKDLLAQRFHLCATKRQDQEGPFR